MNEAIWRPSLSRLSSTHLAAFMRRIGIGVAQGNLDYDSLWTYSINHPEDFWRRMWEYAEIIGDPGDVVLFSGDGLMESRFFPQGQLNYAENLLRHDGADEAIVFYGEDGVRRSWSWDRLRCEISALQTMLTLAGVGTGDRVAGIVANTPETVAAMLATAACGAVWSSCSPDFGVNGILDRFAQITPKVLFCMDGYSYNGKWHETVSRAQEVQAALSSVIDLKTLPYAGWQSHPQDPAEKGREPVSSVSEGIAFRRIGFNDPLFIMFSSGTTGLPKCMVHGAGGTLIQHLKEHQLHCDIRSGDRLMFFTTCGWMMWNWMVSALASGASLVLFDGSPLYPDESRLAEIAEKENVTHFGASAKYFESCSKAGLAPRNNYELQHLRVVLSTGSPLSPEIFRYLYRAWKSDICVSSISGGTDILGCFAGGCPIAPVYPGECQKRLLGMDVQIFNAAGATVTGEAGDLICAAPHPSMPTEFINDPDRTKYRRAYFSRFPDVWTHGDWAELTPHGGIVFFGRSDATLNVGGIRIGTAEICRPTESHEDVLESLVIEYRRGADSQLVLFVRLRDSVALTAELISDLRRRIRSQASPRHVPARIIQVPDLPRTKSGKITELAVRNVVHGQPVNNVSALANPESLNHFSELPELG
ncbi:MAG: acetoacetate--CoA ligase [Rhodobacteraceae bacterium]|nr:acetoacetate--CoA ligase [Paracoccaceae bacterium]